MDFMNLFGLKNFYIYLKYNFHTSKVNNVFHNNYNPSNIFYQLQMLSHLYNSI